LHDLMRAKVFAHRCMSVNRKVTVPVGGLLTLSSLPLLPQGHYNSGGYYRPFLLLPLFTVLPRSPISPKFAEHEEGRGPKKPPPLGRRTRRSPPSWLVLNEHYGVLCGIRVVSKSPQRWSRDILYSEYLAYLSENKRADERTRTAFLLITSDN